MTCTCGHGADVHYSGCEDCDSCNGYQPKAKAAHRCQGGWIPLLRLQLALLDRDDVADELVCAQLGDCARCWRSVALQAINQLANHRAFAARSKGLAADAIVSELQRYLT